MFSIFITAILGICYLFGGLNLEIFEYGFIFYMAITLFVILIIFIPFLIIKYKLNMLLLYIY